ncbi:MAG TPA: hypothetical protein PKG54_17110 [Phycisphaerae bacterium]|jgi:hypothetical protein|nr:hypothetical protein [Phycisphaerae bacterium]HOB76234.1 hypothetical protein [Phycisphaerae bacterium]HOJ56208.1 hypothetical protein [Phycisphaerae bacterium]HOL28066.1 hypothetical protein [Phycisphaerae bacterium]HPP22424.1 hypothetical protein [Phycisphaerae bacterium]
MKYAIGLFAILLCMVLCMGQSCAGLNPGIGDGGDDDGTGGGNPTTQPAQTKGVPKGTYSGKRTLVYTLDNVGDAYPPETQTADGIVRLTFNADGLLCWDNGTPIKVGDVVESSTPYGKLTELVTTITLGPKFTEYYTQAQVTMTGVGGLSWVLVGNGMHSYRLTGGKVWLSAEIDMVSGMASGASYHLTIEDSATLEE